jgi:phytoene dehydrogenase-like protein
MREIEDIGSYDAIVIGSGLAGLMAGNSLVQKGHRVLLLEKHAIAGGCTTNFERKGFRFEASNHVINGCEPGGMTYEQLVKIGAQDRVEFIKLDSFGRVVDETRGTDCERPWAVDAHVALMVELFPEQEDGIRRYYEKYEAMASALLSSFGGSANPDAEASGRMATAVQEFMALKNQKAKDVLAEYVSDPELIRWMTATSSGFLGTSYDEVDAANLIMCDMVFRVNGGDAYYPKGGSGHLSRVLADHFQERGGDLLLKRGVTEIAFSKGRAAGVIARTGGGRTLSAQARCVVCASDLTALVNQLCPEGTLPPAYVKSVNQRVPGISAVILFAGLDIDLRDRGITETKAMRIWGEVQSQTLFEEVGRSGDYSKLPIANATIYSNIDPSCCPEGKSVVTTMVLAEPERFELALDPGRKRGKSYKALKKHLTAQLLEKMARALGIADLERHVEVLELATPVTFERYTGNRAGAYVGWKYSPDQAQDHFSQQSPIENLFLCGHWVAPGGGVSNVMVGGNNAAEIADAYLRS